MTELDMMSPASHRTAAVTSRLAAAFVGGYALVWGFVALCAMLAFAIGMDYGEATTMATLLGYLVYLGVFCWAFAAARVARVWAILLGTGAAMSLAGWVLSLLLASKGS